MSTQIIICQYLVPELIPILLHVTHDIYTLFSDYKYLPSG